jgi:hypothetical protein
MVGIYMFIIVHHVPTSSIYINIVKAINHKSSRIETKRERERERELIARNKTAQLSRPCKNHTGTLLKRIPNLFTQELGVVASCCFR